MALRRPSPLVLVLALALGLGCDDDAEPVGTLDVSELSERFACGDLKMVAARPDGSEALMIEIEDGLANVVRKSKQPVYVDYELPDERVTVRWVAGRNVYRGHCGHNGGGTWKLDARMDAVEGYLSVAIEPGQPGDHAKLSLSAELGEVVFSSEDREREQLVLPYMHLDFDHKNGD